MDAVWLTMSKLIQGFFSDADLTVASTDHARKTFKRPSADRWRMRLGLFTTRRWLRLVLHYWCRLPLHYLAAALRESLYATSE
jgi:hypothetical protein